jgi:hypothetical protein
VVTTVATDERAYSRADGQHHSLKGGGGYVDDEVLDLREAAAFFGLDEEVVADQAAARDDNDALGDR